MILPGYDNKSTEPRGRPEKDIVRNKTGKWWAKYEDVNSITRDDFYKYTYKTSSLHQKL